VWETAKPVECRISVAFHMSFADFLVKMKKTNKEAPTPRDGVRYNQNY